MVGFFCICDILVFDKLRGARLNFSLLNITAVKVMLTTKLN